MFLHVSCDPGAAKSSLFQSLHLFLIVLENAQYCRWKAIFKDTTVCRVETFISIQFGFTQHHNYQPLIGSSAADCPHNTSAFVSTLIIHDSNFSVPMRCDLRAILPWLPWRHIIASKCPMTQQRATCPASSFLPALACNIINQAPKPLYRDHLPEVNTYYFSGPFVLYWDQRVCLCHCVSGCLQARASLCCSCQFVCLCVGTWKWMITLQKSYCTMPALVRSDEECGVSDG